MSCNCKVCQQEGRGHDPCATLGGMRWTGVVRDYKINPRHLTWSDALAELRRQESVRRISNFEANLK